MRLIDADALMKCIPREEYCSRFAVANAPTIEPQRWIPCYEKLSETEALCCDIKGRMIIGYPYKDLESGTGYSAENELDYLICCIAWMPLPEPYKNDFGEL